MKVQVSRSLTHFLCSEVERQNLRGEFDRRHYLVLPSFLEDGLLHQVRSDIRAAAAESRSFDVGDEIGIQAELANALLDFVTNDQVLFDAIDALTGCGGIGWFGGRIYEMRGGGQHQLDWHDDLLGDRLIALSVNLGTEPYQGGVLEIADADSMSVVSRVANVGQGDAVIFRISKRLRHRVTPVEGSVAKMAYAGWFRSEPAYHERMLQQWRELSTVEK